MKPTSIGELVRERIELIGFDPLNASGFTQIPNAILRDKNLTVGAKVCYATLLSYAWQKDSCFPGQETMADDMGVSLRSVVTYIKELEGIGYVEKVRVGLGRTNRYLLHATVKRGRVVSHTR